MLSDARAVASGEIGDAAQQGGASRSICLGPLHGSWLLPPGDTRSPLATSRHLDLRAEHPRHGIGGSFDTGFLAPSEWGAVRIAPSNPTVLEVLRWQRILTDMARNMNEMSDDRFSAWLDADELSGANGMWRRASLWQNSFIDDFAGLGELPFYARAVFELAEPGPNRRQVLEGVGRELGGTPINVMVTELPFGEPRGSLLIDELPVHT